jgi:ribosome-binding protein aMBF1 (putative translation factor)
MLTIVCCLRCILKVALAFVLMPMKKKNILVKFGENVREIRKSKGLSQEQLSFKADLHRTYIGMIERAEKNITLSNIEKIAKALEVEIIELLK